ncbi:VOC family protein [Nocardia neocaledoniensis]|uniref:VOC family protein n=1 Tax=Nocardia neocaledoniensis TaxID=236511 RepID=UPI00245776A0|nr:VOC family protein [Nocardia neocaledoniensis]
MGTPDLDRLVAFYTDLLGGSLSFHRAATPTAPRIAVIDVGGDDHLMFVETATTPSLEPDRLGRTGWGLRVRTHAALPALRDRILRSAWPVDEIETLRPDRRGFARGIASDPVHKDSPLLHTP